MYEYIMDGLTEREAEIYSALIAKNGMLERELRFAKQSILLDIMIELTENLKALDKLSDEEISEVTGLGIENVRNLG